MGSVFVDSSSSLMSGCSHQRVVAWVGWSRSEIHFAYIIPILRGGGSSNPHTEIFEISTPWDLDLWWLLFMQSKCNFYLCVLHISKQVNQIIFLYLNFEVVSIWKAQIISQRSWSCSEGSNQAPFCYVTWFDVFQMTQLHYFKFTKIGDMPNASFIPSE